MERRDLTRRLLAVTALVACAMTGATAASAAPAGDLTVSQTDGLTPGQAVTVSGAGFDESKGIYVAICVDNGPGATPTPCLGGVDMEGTAGGSAWVSSNPPSYAAGLTTPFGPGGTFEVTLPAVAEDAVAGVDCREVSCAVTVRYDHTRADDRTGDVLIPITFAADGAAETPATETPAADATPAAEPTEGVADEAESAEPVDATAEADEDTGVNGPLVAGAIGVVLLAAIAGGLLLARRHRGALAAQAADDDPASPRAN
ncbi:hypothetical protein QUV83_13960 [Cellulomonas cellasea]|uniref:hypothetical protein n=1 Tax=Cellulomonas cellasea TaxID=43670 RepID=UPI0025A31C07|nr:hypothetical protein [Cellulomonas cellasea]MDM8085877.1 hypothetical protein [Cellulomonas cellasea]